MEEEFNLCKEIIYNFEVTEERKRVWQKELEILEKIVEICNENNIKYSLSGGSLLGAVRHKGFIPWDDDIDICMKREEYDKFLKLAQEKLEYPYFVQYYKTEKLYNRGHAQIRNSETTAILKCETTMEGRNNFNKGIFVDIFPLDNVPDNEKERKRFINKVSFKRKFITLTVNNKNLLKRTLKNIILVIYNKEKQIEKFERYVLKYNTTKTKQCGAIAFFPKEFKYENKWFEEYIKIPFEYLEVSCTKDYDELLRRQYGDYMKIPEDKNGSKHGGVIFDTQKSYKEYEKIK